MPRKDFYAILGVQESADPAAIKRAYRRLAFRFHPDAGAHPDPSRFREVNEAYEALLDERRREDEEVILVRSRPGSGSRDPISRPATAEPLFRRRAAMKILDDFDSVAPDIGEFLDHIAQNFFGFHRKSGGPLRRLGVEIVLSPDEARFGCRVPLEVPRYDMCPRCGGGGDSGWGLCPKCHGYGLVEGAARIVLDIPPGCADRTQVEIDLAEAGIENLLLAATILIA
ncbi:MAG TPA: DnaJ domain-containing protein [Candidatus Binataceae bacterium]|nr:DnaJ domain-containing protein [Candidatus Binataceae bacterium]